MATARQWFIEILSDFLTVAAAASTVLAVTVWLTRRWRRGPGRLREATRVLESLSVNIRLAYLRELLGEPQLERVGAKHTEWLWMDDLYIVQAITSIESQQVLRFSIVARSERLRPTFAMAGGNLGQITLGQTRYADLRSQPTSREACAGLATAPPSYVELHALGNPGMYQTFAFGHHVAGPWSDSASERIAEAARAVESRDSDGTSRPAWAVAAISEWRSHEVPNSYGETSPDYTDDEFEWRPSHVTIRVVRTGVPKSTFLS